MSQAVTAARAAERTGPIDDAAEPGSGAAAEMPWPNRPYAWYVVTVLFMASLISFLDRQIIALMVEDIKRDLSLTDFQIGLLQGPPFGIFYAAMAVPIALAADKRNRRNIIAIGIGFWGLATAMCGFAGQFIHMFLARVGVGAGEAALGPSAYSLIPDYFPPKRIPLALAIFTMGNLTGVGFSLVAGGLLLAFLREVGPVALPGLGVFQPWQLAFLCVGVPSGLFALVILTIREPARRGKVRAGEMGTMGEFFAFVRAHNKTVWSILISFALFTLISYANFSWMIVFLLRTFGWTVPQAAFWYGIVVLIFGTGGALFGSWVSGLFVARGHVDATMRAVTYTSIAMTPMSLAIFVLAPSGAWALAFLAVWQVSCASASALGVATLLSIASNRQRAKVTALYSLFANVVGVSLGATSVGFLTTAVFADDSMIRYSMFIVTATGSAAGTLILAWGLKHYRASLAEVARLGGNG